LVPSLGLRNRKLTENFLKNYLFGTLRHPTAFFPAQISASGLEKSANELSISTKRDSAVLLSSSLTLDVFPALLGNQDDLDVCGVTGLLRFEFERPTTEIPDRVAWLPRRARPCPGPVASERL
jgi:hypothetical protein